jgi:DNA-binding NtrC family response regulator
VVLFVDDNPAIVDAIAMLLEAEGIAVHVAMNGDEALIQIQDGLRPDIVISDYRLPGYSGVELLRRVRKLIGEVPAILVTGDTTASEIEAASLDNCTILHKPVDLDRLIALIERRQFD